MIARIGCVVLAAGEGRRMGGSGEKLLLPFRGKPLLQQAIDVAAASRAMSCSVVLGANETAVEQSVDTRRCVLLSNPRWKEGIAASISCGLAFHADDDACIFMVADQPFVQSLDLDRLIARFRLHRNAIVALRAGDVWGTPALFPREDFRALARLRGDFGAKRHAQRHVRRVQFITAASGDAFVDVDVPEDCERLRQPDERM